MGTGVWIPSWCLFSPWRPPVFVLEGCGTPHVALGGDGEEAESTSRQSLQAEEDLWLLSFCKDNNCAGLWDGGKLPKKGSVAAQPPLLGAFQRAGNVGGGLSCWE